MGRRILFGVDNSFFARQAIAAVGGLLRNSEDLDITIFHGASEPDLDFLSSAANLSPEVVERCQRTWRLEEQKALEQAKEALTESGFDPKRIATAYEEKCNDPAESMLKLAASEGFETLALGRWGANTVSRQMIGSVTYRLANLAENQTLWVIDPRVSSNNVLVNLVGAAISRRVMEHTVRYFSDLEKAKFTFFHVIPHLPPKYWDHGHMLNEEDFQEKIAQWMKEYTHSVKEIAHEGRERLIKAGVPEQNVVVKIQAQERGIARDILAQLEEGNYGILVMGRKGIKDISQFALGSKTSKLLQAAHTLITCLVN
jgi:nucleotide-binding universal stress UspA family protein